MEHEGDVTFCQNELQNEFAALEDMRQRGQFCDLTIKVGERSFTAHRVIVAARIPYFQSVFENSGLGKEIVMEDLDPCALDSLLSFAYTSKVRISTENAQSLLVAAQFLQLDQVRDACVEFLSKRLRINNVIQIRTLADGINNSDLIESSNLYICKNFEEFSKHTDFLNLPHSWIKEIISSDDLITSNEKFVFEAVMKWVKVSPSERHAVLLELLREVRLFYLPIAYLRERVDTEELIKTSEPCRDLVNEVKRYHLLLERASELSNLKMRPRNRFTTNLYSVCSCATCGFSVYYLDLINDIWHILASKKMECRTIHGVVAVNGKIYVLLDEQIITFCLETQKCELLESRYGGIKESAIVSCGNVIYCFGSAEEFYRNVVRRFDTQQNQWLKEENMKTGRWSSAGTVLEYSIYVAGGCGDDTPINTVEKYNPSTGEWSDIQPLLTARDKHGCVGFNGKIYVCGGYDSDDEALNSAEVYDPVTNQWNFISPMHNAKNCLTLALGNGRIYALATSDMEVYDPEKDEWKCCLNVPARFQGAVSIPTASIKRNRN